MIGLLVASDNHLYLQHLAACLADAADLAVLDVVGDRESLLVALGRARADVVLLDMSMTGSLEMVRLVAGRPEEIRVIGLGLSEVEDVVIPCIEAGLAGYLPRNGTVGDLLKLVRSVARGQAFASPQIVASMFRRLNQRSTVHVIAPARVLSSREREIVDMLEVGCSNKEIAAELKIRLPTVKKHVHSIFVKLQVTRRAQVAETLRRDRRRQWRVVQGSPEAAEATHFPTVLAAASRSFGG